MEKRLKYYLEYYRQMSVNVKSGDGNLPDGKEAFLKEMLIQIGFFQHERFIHLVVTVLFAILAVFSVIAFVAIMQISIIVLAGMFFVLLIPYIRHYFILENGVQQLYEYYDIIAHSK